MFALSPVSAMDYTINTIAGASAINFALSMTSEGQLVGRFAKDRNWPILTVAERSLSGIRKQDTHFGGFMHLPY